MSRGRSVRRVARRWSFYKPIQQVRQLVRYGRLVVRLAARVFRHVTGGAQRPAKIRRPVVCYWPKSIGFNCSLQKAHWPMDF